MSTRGASDHGKMSAGSPRDVPAERVRRLNDCAVQARGEYVLYWMTAYRRTHWNYALQHALNWSARLERPLIVLEAMRCGYRWASDRLHAFVVQGMADNERRLAERPALYYPYLEPEPGAGEGLLAALARRACLVVADDYPCFFLPRMLAVAARGLDVAAHAVDANGILPLRAAPQVFSRAFDFRRFLQKRLPPYLARQAFPAPDPWQELKLPIAGELPRGVARHWPRADVATLAANCGQLADFPLDHQVPPAPVRGGSDTAERALQDFVRQRLSQYLEARNEPEREITSGLSPYLHFGHVAPHQIVNAVLRADGWSSRQLAAKATGSAQGWWGATPPVESFLDELITWRELGFNMCWQRPDYARFSSLPDWARDTLDRHARDPRAYRYDLDQFDAADTHDRLWNAAQRQLVRTGRIHNYLRMLWGKKILEWSASPREALATMIELNNKYALDGRDPNSYSGIFWVLGRYDRPWGPERPVFGKVRYMSSENTARKVDITGYLRMYGA